MLILDVRAVHTGKGIHVQLKLIKHNPSISIYMSSILNLTVYFMLQLEGKCLVTLLVMATIHGMFANVSYPCTESFQIKRKSSIRSLTIKKVDSPPVLYEIEVYD